jgi:prefoldin beta subunit
MKKHELEDIEEECEDECDDESHEHQHSENPFENLDEDTQRKIQEMQIFEQNFQQLLMQKQTFNFELNETDYALEELKKAEGEVFKVVGNQIIVKSTKDNLEKELIHKKELIELRLKNIDKQEKEFSEKLNALREELIKKISKNNRNK